MKKTFLSFSLLFAFASFAQKASHQLTFVKGQKMEVVAISTIQAESLMGPASGTVTVSDVYSVNDVAPNAISLVKTPKLIKIALRSGSQEINLDSDNPKDLSGPLGEPIKEIMSVKPDFTIDAAGKVVSVKKEKRTNETSQQAGMMAMMMPGMNVEAAIPTEGRPSFFQVLPNKAVGIGDSWTDSVNTEGNKNITEYKVKDITDKEIILDFDGSGSSVTSQSIAGQTIEVNATTKGTGSVILDKATGILKQKTMTSSTETTMNIAGQAMTSSAKTTSVINVTMQ